MKIMGIVFASMESEKSWKNNSTYPVIIFQNRKKTVINLHVKGLFGFKGLSIKARFKWFRYCWYLLLVRSWKMK